MQVRCRRNWHGTVLLGFGMGGMVAGRDRETEQGTALHDPSPGPLLSRHITYKDCQSVVVAHEFLKSMSRPDRATKHDHLDTACKYDNAVDFPFCSAGERFFVWFRVVLLRGLPRCVFGPFLCLAHFTSALSLSVSPVSLSMIV